MSKKYHSQNFVTMIFLHLALRLLLAVTLVGALLRLNPAASLGALLANLA